MNNSIFFSDAQSFVLNQPPTEGVVAQSYPPIRQIASQRSLTSLQRVIKDIANDVEYNINKWNEKTEKGLELLKLFHSVRTNCSAMFPSGLESTLKELYEVVKALSIYPKALTFLATQINSVSRLNPQIMVVFNNVYMSELIRVVDEIAMAYRSELKIRDYVLENVAYSSDGKEVEFHIQSWAQPKYVTADIDKKVDDLLKATGSKM